MTATVSRHFVKCLFNGREEPLVYQVDEETADRIRRNVSGEPAAFCCFSTLDGREIAINLSQLDLIHYLWDAAMPELRAVEHHPACLYFVGRDDAFICDPEEEDEAFNVFFLLELDGAEMDRFLELTDEDGEVVVFDARKLQVIEMSSALVAEGRARFEKEIGAESDESGPACRACAQRMPFSRPRRCPECGHVFKGNGWDGIDAHWKAKHTDVMSYREFWASLCLRHKRGS